MAAWPSCGNDFLSVIRTVIVDPREDTHCTFDEEETERNHGILGLIDCVKHSVLSPTKNTREATEYGADFYP